MPLHVSIKNLYIYPLKSAAGISLQSVELDHLGLVFDRRWMVVDKDLCFITQRQDERLANIMPIIEGQNLTLVAPSVGMIDLELRYHPSAEQVKRCKSKVWDRLHDVIHCGSIASEWISSYLGYEAHIVRLLDTKDSGLSHSFVDSSQVLIISQESVDALNQRLKSPIDMARFRPNVVVRNCGSPNEEDTWRMIRINDSLFQSVKACTRCVMITIDQSTLAKNSEPLVALANYRRQGSAVIFGQYYAIRALGRATISVTDRVFSEMAD